MTDGIEIGTKYNVPHEEELKVANAAEFKMGVTQDNQVVYVMKLPCGCCAVEFTFSTIEAAEHMLRTQLHALHLARSVIESGGVVMPAHAVKH